MSRDPPFASAFFCHFLMQFSICHFCWCCSCLCLLFIYAAAFFSPSCIVYFRWLTLTSNNVHDICDRKALTRPCSFPFSATISFPFRLLCFLHAKCNANSSRKSRSFSDKHSQTRHRINKENTKKLVGDGHKRLFAF